MGPLKREGKRGRGEREGGIPRDGRWEEHRARDLSVLYKSQNRDDQPPELGKR